MDLRTLWRQDFRVDVVCVLCQRWKTGQVFHYRQHTRPENGLIYFFKSTYLYETKSGEKRYAKPGDLIFLSKHSQYSATCMEGNGKDISSLLVNFHITDEEGRDFYPDEPLIFLDAFPREEAEQALRQMDALYRAQSYAPAEMKGILCQLLARISRTLDGHGQDYPDERLRPAMRWLEEHYQEEISVPALAALCCMSESGFRKRFTEQLGVSPVRYRMERRIEHSKRLMQANTLPIREIALTVGFDDLNYFCRVFRKIVGMSPRVYMKI